LDASSSGLIFNLHIACFGGAPIIEPPQLCPFAINVFADSPEGFQAGYRSGARTSFDGAAPDFHDRLL
jgi:hypothetical protein